MLQKPHLIYLLLLLIVVNYFHFSKYQIIYKNNEMAGIYYDVNTALDQIDDSSADYRLVLGIGTDGVLGLTLNKDCYYYLDSYQTNKTSINCKSLSIEKCETYGQGKTPTFKAPASLLNQGNISFKTVTSSAS